MKKKWFDYSRETTFFQFDLNMLIKQIFTFAIIRFISKPELLQAT